LGDLTSKHKGKSDDDQPESSSEIGVMKDWIDNTQGDIPETDGSKPKVDVALGYKDREMTVNPAFTKYYYEGVSHYEDGRYSESVDYFGKALKINPNHNEAYRYLLKAFYFVRQKNRNMAG
jgi:tetratricopeptide (TPR) repeat protein